MAITAAMSTQVTQLYVSLFDRAPERDGLGYWVQELGAGKSLTTVAAEMFAVEPARAVYPLFFTNEQIVSAFYTNVLGRAPDTEGLNYWTAKLNASTPGAVVVDLINAVVNYTGTDAAGVMSKSLFDNKVAAGLHYAVTDLGNDPVVAAQINALVTADAPGAAVGSGADAAIAAADGSGQVNTTLTLTTGIDAVVGTAGNDTIIATLDNTGSAPVNTLNVGDSIVGGVGTDTLKIVSASTSSVDLRVATISGVEKLVINDVDNNISSNTFLGSNDFSTVTLQNFDDANVYGIKEGTAIVAQAGPGSTYNWVNTYSDATAAASVTINDTFKGNSTASDGGADFYHGYDNGNGSGLISAATTVNATLNLVDANSIHNNYDWATQYIYANNVGNVATAITTTTNIINATSTADNEYSGTDTYIYRNADATVTSNINITNSANVYADVYANNGGAAANAAVDVINVTLDGVTNDNYSAVYAYDFETVKIVVNGAASLDDLSFYESSDTPTAQTVSIVANADLTVGSSDYNDAGSVAVTVSGSGNVDLGTYDGTHTALSTTVSDKIDASALTGDFSVDVTRAINSVKGGSGDDTIVIRDVSTFGDATKGGLVLSGGAGTDTIGFDTADWATIATGTPTNRLAISGFEALELHGALADVTTYDISKLSGIVSFTAADGVATGGTATVSNLGANATVTLAGDLSATHNDGALVGTLKTDTDNDTATLVLKSDYTEDNAGATGANTGVASHVTLAEIEHLTVNSTGHASVAFAGATGVEADYVTNTLTLTDDSLVTLAVTGDQALVFATASTELALTTINASANTAGVTIDAHLTAATAAALTITGSATASNSLTGSGNADTIVGGAKADTITGGAKGDTLTGGAGNDTFAFAAGDSSIGTGTFDTITDFSANTKGDATSGAVSANADSTLWTGDVLTFAATSSVDGTGGFKVDVLTSAADATTYLSNHSGSATTIFAALDSTNHNLYVDNTGDGVADFFIHLTGVNTISAAAFVLAAV
jgi:hypothetical protein